MISWTSYLFPLLCVILLLYASPEGILEMALSDLQKLVANMKRAQGITDRAARDAEKHSAIMDKFEQRLDLNQENMAKIEEYEKLMAQMDQLGSNGGPALESTFSSSTPDALPPKTSISSEHHLFDLKSGKQL